MDVCSVPPRREALVPASIYVSERDYVGHYWPQLRNAIQHILSIRAGQTSSSASRISFEQVYSCVYKCVCNQLSERLFSDVKSLITSYFEIVLARMKECQEEDFVLEFKEILCQYSYAAQQISRVFTYMNRSYVEPKLHTTFQKVLMVEFSRHVVDACFSRLIGALLVAHTNPFTVSPPIMASIVTELYALQPEYAKMAPELFAVYIPNILPPMSLEDIPKHVAEVHWIQERLTREGYSRDSTPLKRPLDSENARVDTS